MENDNKEINYFAGQICFYMNRITSLCKQIETLNFQLSKFEDVKTELEIKKRENLSNLQSWQKAENKLSKIYRDSNKKVEQNEDD